MRSVGGYAVVLYLVNRELYPRLGYSIGGGRVHNMLVVKFVFSRVFYGLGCFGSTKAAQEFCIYFSRIWMIVWILNFESCYFILVMLFLVLVIHYGLFDLVPFYSRDCSFGFCDTLIPCWSMLRFVSLVCPQAFSNFESTFHIWNRSPFPFTTLNFFWGNVF